MYLRTTKVPQKYHKSTTNKSTIRYFIVAHICSQQYFDLLFLLPESLIYEICHQNAKNSHSRSGRIGKVPQKLTKTGSNLMCPTKVPQNSHKIPIRDFIVYKYTTTTILYYLRLNNNNMKIISAARRNSENASTIIPNRLFI